MKTRQWVSGVGMVLLLTAGVLRADMAEDWNKIEDNRVEISQAQAQDRAVKALEKLGGKVGRDEKAWGKPVVAVNLNFTQVTDVRLKELAALPHLHALALQGTWVTDASLKHLSILKQLDWLNLRDTQVTDRGVHVLQLLLPGCDIIR